jgi:hypothetical protein
VKTNKALHNKQILNFNFFSKKKEKSSAQLCEEHSITNVEINYTAKDFQTLVTYKLFNSHIRPMLVEKNPKLVMYKMVSVIGAKWREFIELKEQHQQTEKEQAGAAAVSADSSSSASSKSDTEPTAATNNKKETIEQSDEKSTEPATAAAVAVETVVSRRGRVSRKRGYDYNESNDDQPSAAVAATDSSNAANEAAIAAATAELESTRRTSSRTKKTATYSKMDEEVANSPASSETGGIKAVVATAAPATTSNSKKANGADKQAASAKSTEKTAAAAATVTTTPSAEKTEKSGKSTKKRKKRDGDEGGGTNYNDSDAEFEAMLEEQCRMDENEQAKKKQRQAVRQAAAETKNPKSTIISTNLTPKGGLVNGKAKTVTKAKMKNSAEPDEFEVEKKNYFLVFVFEQKNLLSIFA